MVLGRTFITDFQVIDPPFQTKQKDSLDWLAAAHAQADCFAAVRRPKEFYEELFRKVGCSPLQIGFRSYCLPDFSTTQWNDMQVYRLDQSPTGVGMDARMAFYQYSVEDIFERLYKNELTPSQHIIHVTCTGYVSPSGAQVVIAKKGWSQITSVTHAYHMGCYGCIPALRIARGYLASDNKSMSTGPRLVDIVHTELCGLHLNPAKHASEQCVIQSLFADGIIRYRVMTHRPDKQAYEVLSLLEEIIPDSAKAMRWYCSDWGMQMSLSKEVPDLIKDHLRAFISRLGAQGNIELNDRDAPLFYAIHPGGPKILDRVAQQLELSDNQLKASRDILFSRGNMSSATLPHIWEKILTNSLVPSGALVLSLAFGPGLTIVGALMKKI